MKVWTKYPFLSNISSSTKKKKKGIEKTENNKKVSLVLNESK